jgi:hydroxypyruvate isomerase
VAGDAAGSAGIVRSRLSCADSAFPKLSHDAALAVISDLAIGAVDICVFAGYEHTPPEAVIGDPKGAADAVLRRLERTPLVVADVFAILRPTFEDLAVNHPDQEVRRESRSHFQRVIDFAQRIDAPGLTIQPGMAFAGVDPKRSLGVAAAELRHRATIAGEAGLRLSIEPHYQSIVETPGKTLELLEQAPEVSLSLDYSHFVFQGISQDEVDALVPYSGHVHLRQAAPGVMQARAEEGSIDFQRVTEKLNAGGYRGYLALEYQHEEWLDCQRVDCISETAALRDIVLG